MNAQKLGLFAATLLIDNEQIKNKGRKELKYVITKTLEEKLEDEERTEEQKSEVFTQILEDFYYLEDHYHDTNTGNSNQPKTDS